MPSAPTRPPIVFLPGAGGRAAFWAPVAERLADLGPVHRLAWPGFGDVPPDPAIGSLDDLFGWLLARLPGGASHVVAQSMGGVLAARLAIERPLVVVPGGTHAFAEERADEVAGAIRAHLAGDD